MGRKRKGVDPTPAVDPTFSIYLLGSEAALEDSKEQQRLMELWRKGEGNKPVDGVSGGYWRGLRNLPSWLQEDFKEGYREKWTREVELFRDRLFD